MIRLVIFDVDGTLAQSSTLNLLPHVKEFFRLVSSDCQDLVKVAIATNQGGVGMHYWMEQQQKGKNNKYPSQADVETRMRLLLIALGAPIPVYMSFRYMDKKEKWSPVPAGQDHDPRWSKEWRKPGPGMLRQAMADAGAAPEESLYVGDREEDLGAAKAAGCAFQWAKDFFISDWGDCQAISERLNTIPSTESK